MLPAGVRWVDDATTTVKEKTYGEFVADIRKMTGYLQETVANLKGQRIAILSRTNYEYGVVTFGTMMAGAVIVTLNQKKTWPELEYELGLSEPALILHRRHRLRLRRGAEGCLRRQAPPHERLRGQRTCRL